MKKFLYISFALCIAARGVQACPTCMGKIHKTSPVFFSREAEEELKPFTLQESVIVENQEDSEDVAIAANEGKS